MGIYQVFSGHWLIEQFWQYLLALIAGLPKQLIAVYVGGESFAFCQSTCFGSELYGAGISLLAFSCLGQSHSRYTHPPDNI
jgi:hypothetical protein